jgi:hypothetical protein
VRAARQQQRDYSGSAAWTGRFIQRGLPSRIAQIDARTAFDQQFHHFGVAVRRTEHERRNSAVNRSIDVAAALERSSYGTNISATDQLR